MSSTKECPSCGAKNDVIFTNCMFCKSSLPSMDLNSLTNDDLIMNASEWVAKTADSVLVIDNPNAKGLDKAFGGQKFMQRPEIIGNAEKYLNLLAVRATSNPTLAIVYQDLKFKLEKNQKKLSTTAKTLIGVGLTFIVLGIIIGFGISHENEGPKLEKQKLEKIEMQIDNAIQSKNYDYALVLVENLHWTVDLDYERNKALALDYDKKRESLKQAILKLKESSNTQTKNDGNN